MRRRVILGNHWHGVPSLLFQRFRSSVQITGPQVHSLSLLAKHNWWPTKVRESVRRLVSAAITGFFDWIVFWVCFIVCMAEKHISPPGFRELRACVWVKCHVKVVLVCCFLVFLRSHPNRRLAWYHFGVKFPLHSVLGWLRVLCWRKEIAFSPVNSSKSSLGF